MQFWQTVALAGGVAIVGVTTGAIWELSRWGKRGVRKEKSEVEGDFGKWFERRSRR